MELLDSLLGNRKTIQKFVQNILNKDSADCKIKISNYSRLYDKLTCELMAQGNSTSQTIDLVDNQLYGVCPNCGIVTTGEQLSVCPLIDTMGGDNVRFVSDTGESDRLINGLCKNNKCFCRVILIAWVRKPTKNEKDLSGVIKAEHALFFILQGNQNPILCVIVRKEFVSTLKNKGYYPDENCAAKNAAILMFLKTFFPTSFEEMKTEVHYMVKQRATITSYKEVTEILQNFTDEHWEVPVYLAAWPAPGITNLFDAKLASIYRYVNHPRPKQQGTAYSDNSPERFDISKDFDIPVDFLGKAETVIINYEGPESDEVLNAIVKELTPIFSKKCRVLCYISKVPLIIPSNEPFIGRIRFDPVSLNPVGEFSENVYVDYVVRSKEKGLNYDFTKLGYWAGKVLDRQFVTTICFD